MQALAHACVPDSVPASLGAQELPAEVEQAVDALCPHLCALIEPTNEMEDLSPAGAVPTHPCAANEAPAIGQEARNTHGRYKLLRSRCWPALW